MKITEEHVMAEQIRNIDKEIAVTEDLLKSVDSVISLYQQERTSLIGRQAQLNTLKDLVNSTTATRSEPEFSTSKVGGSELVANTAVAATVIVSGSVLAGVVAVGGMAINAALDHSISAVEAHNAKIEQQLRDQKAEMERLKYQKK